MMTYILYIWTAIAIASNPNMGDHGLAMGWRPIGEYHDGPGKSSRDNCEDAARQLELRLGSYHCVRNK